MSRRPKYSSEYQKVASKIYSRLKSRVKAKYDLEDYWGRGNFITWYIDKEKKCCYCGCSEDETKAFYETEQQNLSDIYEPDEYKRKRIRGKTLEIERKEDEKYTEDNCELACYWCNNAKSDVFTFEEFKPIGKAIGDAIKARIKVRN